MSSLNFTRINKKNKKKTTCSWFAIKKIIKENYDNPQEIINALMDDDIEGFEIGAFYYKKSLKVIDINKV